MCTLFRAPIEQVAQSTLTAVSNCNTKKQGKQHYNQIILDTVNETAIVFITSRILNICLRGALSYGKYYYRREYDPLVITAPSAILSFGRYTMFVRYIRSTFPPHRQFTVQLLISILVKPNWL